MAEERHPRKRVPRKRSFTSGLVWGIHLQPSMSSHSFRCSGWTGPLRLHGAGVGKQSCHDAEARACSCSGPRRSGRSARHRPGSSTVRVVRRPISLVPSLGLEVRSAVFRAEFRAVVRAVVRKTYGMAQGCATLEGPRVRCAPCWYQEFRGVPCIQCGNTPRGEQGLLVFVSSTYRACLSHLGNKSSPGGV